MLTKTFKLLSFSIFLPWANWWRIFEKCIMHTKSDTSTLYLLFHFQCFCNSTSFYKWQIKKSSSIISIIILQSITEMYVSVTSIKTQLGILVEQSYISSYYILHFFYIEICKVMNGTTDQNYYNCNKPWSLSSTLISTRYDINMFISQTCVQPVSTLRRQIWYLYYQCTPQ